MEEREDVAFLVGSDNRVSVLASLAEGAARPCELRESTDASRTAVHRALNGFEERGWVRKRDERYELTAAGRHVFQGYRSLTATIRRGERFSEFLREFPAADDLPFPFDGTVAVATRADPGAATALFRDGIPASPERLRGVVPVLNPAFAEAFEPTVESGAQIRLVVDPAAATRLRESRPELVALAEERATVGMWVAQRTVPFGLALFEDRLFLGAYGGRGQFRACLQSTDEDLRRWATDRYRALAGNATPITEPSQPLEDA